MDLSGSLLMLSVSTDAGSGKLSDLTDKLTLSAYNDTGDDESTCAPSTPTSDTNSDADDPQALGMCTYYFHLDSDSSEDGDEDCITEMQSTLEWGKLLPPLPRHRLSPIHELGDENVDDVVPYWIQAAFDCPAKVTASAAVSRGRKDKNRVVDEPIKKRPLFAYDLPKPDDEYEPVSVRVRPELLDDSFSNFMQGIIVGGDR